MGRLCCLGPPALTSHLSHRQRWEAAGRLMCVRKGGSARWGAVAWKLLQKAAVKVMPSLSLSFQLGLQRREMASTHLQAAGWDQCLVRQFQLQGRRPAAATAPPARG